MGKNKNPVTGYKYFFGIHMGLSRGPINEIVEIKVGKKTAWQGSISDTGSVQIDAPELFGGDKQEGGVVGKFEVMMGKSDQKAIPALVSMLGHALPGFRRMCTAFFDGTIASNSPYPKAWTLRTRRTTKGWQNDMPWYPEKAMIELKGDPQKIKPAKTPKTNKNGEPAKWDDEDAPETITKTPMIHSMNPAHIIYECLTNSEWGRGLPVSALNVASFTRVADTLFDEKFGLCLRWTRRDSMEEFIQSVIDHIGAVIYADRESALLTLKLIRLDYEFDSLPIYDTDSGILEIREAEASALGPAVNEIVVEYTDPITGETRTVNQQNLASLQASRGVFNSLKKQYPGLPTNELARRVAQRDLRVNAISLRRYTITFDRRAWRLPPAGVIRIRDVERGIGDIALRIGKIEDGTLQKGAITITAVQDVFSLPRTSFIGTEPPNWIKPDTRPILKNHRAFEVPYFLLVAGMTPADFAFLGNDAGFLGTVVEKPTDLALGYDLHVKPGEITEDDYPPTPAA